MRITRTKNKVPIRPIAKVVVIAIFKAPNQEIRHRNGHLFWLEMRLQFFGNISWSQKHVLYNISTFQRESRYFCCSAAAGWLLKN
jgi:hypothetical protein